MPKKTFIEVLPDFQLQPESHTGDLKTIAQSLKKEFSKKVKGVLVNVRQNLNSKDKFGAVYLKCDCKQYMFKFEKGHVKAGHLITFSVKSKTATACVCDQNSPKAPQVRNLKIKEIYF